MNNEVLVNKILAKVSEGYRSMIMVYAANGVNKSYEDTMFRQAFITAGDARGLQFYEADARPERIVKTVFVAISAFLSKRKVSKADEAEAFIIQDLSGNFRFAAIVEYHINETNPDEPGNWSYVMTFNEDDLTDLEKRKKVNKFLIGDDAFKSIIDKTAYDVGSLSFEQEIFIYEACNMVIDAILQVLDTEAKPDCTVDIDLPGYVTASVAIENGEKVFSITPNGHLKVLIKSDVNLDSGLVPPEDVEPID